MDVKTRFVPLIISLVLTPIALALGIMSAGAGHGNYFLAKILFPFTMLSTIYYESITFPFLLLGVVQIPVYGLFISALRNRRTSLMLLSLLHTVFVILALSYVGRNFS
jgi:hypothetical protein